MSALRYNSLSREVTVHYPLDEMPMRDKVNLYCHLMDELGVTERFHLEPDTPAKTIIEEQCHKAWEGK